LKEEKLILFIGWGKRLDVCRCHVYSYPACSNNIIFYLVLLYFSHSSRCILRFKIRFRRLLNLASTYLCRGKVEVNAVRLCFRLFLLSYNQEICVAKTTVDVIKICDSYFIVCCWICSLNVTSAIFRYSIVKWHGYILTFID
jgi:hypothetical protein